MVALQLYHNLRGIVKIHTKFRSPFTTETSATGGAGGEASAAAPAGPPNGGPRTDGGECPPATGPVAEGVRKGGYDTVLGTAARFLNGISALRNRIASSKTR